MYPQNQGIKLDARPKTIIPRSVPASVFRRPTPSAIAPKKTAPTPTPAMKKDWTNLDL